VSEPASGWQAARTAQMSPKSVGLNPNTTVSIDVKICVWNPVSTDIQRINGFVAYYPFIRCHPLTPSQNHFLNLYSNRAVEPEEHALPSLLFWLCRPRTIINFS